MVVCPGYVIRLSELAAQDPRGHQPNTNPSKSGEPIIVFRKVSLSGQLPAVSTANSATCLGLQEERGDLGAERESVTWEQLAD